MKSTSNVTWGRVAAWATVATALFLVSTGEPALAAGGGTITGKVDATPAKYLPDTVVFLKNVPGSYTPKTVDMDQKGMKFIPHLLTVTAGDTVRYLNSDPMDHNVFSPDNEGFNLGTFKSGETRSYTYKTPGTVYSQLCSVHPDMLGYVVVGQNPYAAKVDAGGAFTIKDVPPGTYQLAVWNAKLKGAEQSVTVAAGASVDVSVSVKR